MTLFAMNDVLSSSQYIKHIIVCLFVKRFLDFLHSPIRKCLFFTKLCVST
jgi:hypothetical protein